MENSILKALEEGATVVTGSNRLARTLRLEYNAIRQQRGEAAWRAPTALRWQAWMSALWEDFQFRVESPPALLDPWQERMLWQRAVIESDESSSLLQVGGAAAAAQEAWALATEWRLNLAFVERDGNEDSRVFAGWARRFRDWCGEDRLIEGARLADYLRGAMVRLPLPARVVLAGFDEFTPQQSDFIEKCRAAGCAIETAAREAGSQAANTVRVCFADPSAEIEAAARWARALLAREPDVRIGVVVPDLSARSREVARAFRNVLEPAAQLPGHHKPHGLFHVSAGEPLSMRPLVTSALSLLGLSPQRNEWNRLSGLVLSPYVAGAVTERASRGLLDARMRKAGEMRVSIAALRRLCRESGSPCPRLDATLGRWLHVLDQAPRTQSAAAWSRTFSELLESLGWPGEQSLTSVEYQTGEAWNRVLSQFAATDAFAGALSAEGAASLLECIAAETAFQPEAEQAPVEVLGTLEASGLRFDHLWVAGLHDEAWPGPPKPNPFLPFRMQREQGLPQCSPERELEYATLITRRLLASAPDVVVSYPALVEDREVAPSPLILPVRKIGPEDLAIDDCAAYAESIRDSRVMEQMVDEQAPPLGDEAWQRGGTKVFQYQSTCPFRAFAELRLGAEELDTPVPGLDVRRRGNLVHAALEEFWKEVRTHDALCGRTDISEVIRKSVGMAMARLEQDTGSAIPERFAALERRRLERIVSEWIELEKRRGWFEVMQPEREQWAELGGVRARIRIDRIDRLRDGREIIIDYKTGRTTVSAWETERPGEPQLPLYSAIHERPLAGVLFGQVKAGELRFRGWTAEAGLVPGVDATDLAAMVRDWRVVLERLAREFRAGRAEVDPKDPESCRRCSRAALCRIAEYRAPDDEDEAER